MRVDPNSSSMVALRERVAELLQGKRVVLGFPDQLSLSAISWLPVIRERLNGAATTEAEAFESCCNRKTDVLLVTERLEHGRGADLVRKVRDSCPSCVCLYFLHTETPEAVALALDAGAQGVMFISTLGTGIGDFSRALDVCFSGGVYYPANVRKAAKRLAPKKTGPSLSPRELDVLKLIGEGRPNPEIAKDLGIGLETVKSRVKSVIEKLDARDRTHAAVMGVRLGLLEP